MIVPVLVVLLKLPMQEAAGTSLMVIAMNAGAGVLGYAGHVEIPWLFLAGFTSVAVGGILVGAACARKIPARILRRAFAALVLAMALTILYYNRSAIPGLAALPGATRQESYGPRDHTRVPARISGQRGAHAERKAATLAAASRKGA
jgi:hypothetical protein